MCMKSGLWPSFLFEKVVFRRLFWVQWWCSVIYIVDVLNRITQCHCGVGVVRCVMCRGHSNITHTSGVIFPWCCAYSNITSGTAGALSLELQICLRQSQLRQATGKKICRGAICWLCLTSVILHKFWPGPVSSSDFQQSCMGCYTARYKI